MGSTKRSMGDDMGHGGEGREGREDEDEEEEEEVVVEEVKLNG